jgi:hypothetical protein
MKNMKVNVFDVGKLYGEGLYYGEGISHHFCDSPVAIGDHILFAPRDRTFWRLHTELQGQFMGVAPLPGFLETEHGCFEYGTIDKDFLVSFAELSAPVANL